MESIEKLDIDEIDQRLAKRTWDFLKGRMDGWVEFAESAEETRATQSFIKRIINEKYLQGSGLQLTRLYSESNSDEDYSLVYHVQRQRQDPPDYAQDQARQDISNDAPRTF